MTLTDGDVVVFTLTAGILPGPGRRRGDFMATVKVTPAGQLEGEYRFRWWNTSDKLDMDGGADDDEKSFWAFAGPDGPAEREKVFSSLRRIAGTLPGFVNVHEETGAWSPEEFVHEVMMRGPMRTQLTREELPK